MSKCDQSSVDLDWCEGGIFVLCWFDDLYFSLNGGLVEMWYVFLVGNDLFVCLVFGFYIVELGFGIGLNLLVLVQIVWQLICFISFEVFLMGFDELICVYVVFFEFVGLLVQLCVGWVQDSFCVGQVQVCVICGDVCLMLFVWQDCVDVWFLDGFFFVKNLELWGEDLLVQVVCYIVSGGSFVIYIVVGYVWCVLVGVGFVVSCVQGFVGKCYMSVGCLVLYFGDV